MGKLFTCEEVAERYRVQVITVWDWIRKKKLPAIKIGKSYLISEEELQRYEESAKTVKVIE
jgi:excisionase family DNA binding protein